MNRFMKPLAAQALVLFALLALHTLAIAQTPPPYGPPITIEQARVAMAAAEAEAKKNGWQVVISIVEPGGHLVMLHRLDAQYASVDISIGKARTAASFRRPTKVLEESMATGGSTLRILAVRDAYPLQGGLPIVIDGKIVGAIGVSGVLASQDEMVAKAGLDALTSK